MIEDQPQETHDEHWLSRIKRNVVNFFSQEVKDEEKPLKKHNQSQIKKIKEHKISNLKKSRFLDDNAKKQRRLKQTSRKSFRPKRQDEEVYVNLFPYNSNQNLQGISFLSFSDSRMTKNLMLDLASSRIPKPVNTQNPRKNSYFNFNFPFRSNRFRIDGTI